MVGGEVGEWGDKLRKWGRVFVIVERVGSVLGGGCCF